MAKVGARDLTNFYDFGPQNDPTNPELSHRMYFDLSTTIGNNVLMVADQAFNIISEYQGWPASLIVGVGTPIVSKSDICVLNDQGLNSFPPVANRVNPIYRMYIAKRPITVNVPTLVTLWEIPYTDAKGSFVPGENIKSDGGGVGIIFSDTPGVAVGTGTLIVYGTSGTFSSGDVLTSGAITANTGDNVKNLGQEIVNIETEYECSLLIVNQRFEIEYIVPLLEGFVPFETLSAGAICCSYDYGFNAQSTDQNYIWHMYVSDYTVDPGTEFEQIVPNCLLIVNRDFKVGCYQTPLP